MSEKLPQHIQNLIFNSTQISVVEDFKLSFLAVPNEENIELPAIFWTDLAEVANKFTQLHSIYFENKQEANTDIFWFLPKFPFISELEFRGTLTDSEKYIGECFLRMPSLKKITFAGTQLLEMPALPLEKLTSLGVYWESFHLHNFSFPVDNTKNVDIFLEFLTPILSQRFNQNFKKYNWGLANENNSILVCLNDIKVFTDFGASSISISILKSYCRNAEYNRYEMFKAFYSAVNEANIKIPTLKKIDDNNLEIYLEYRPSRQIQQFSDLKSKYRRKDLHSSDIQYFTDSLIYLGGEQLIEELDMEKQTYIESFYKENPQIEEIEIENFKLFEKIKLTNLGRINIIIGKNGVGKTSLLQAISAGILTSTRENAIENPISLINSKLLQTPTANKIAKITTSWRMFRKSQKISFVGTEEAILPNKFYNELPDNYLLQAYGENLYALQPPYIAEKSYFSQIFNDYQDFISFGSYKSQHVTSIFKISYEYMVNPIRLLNELSESELKEKYRSKKNEFTEIRTLIESKLNYFLEKSDTLKLRLQKDGAYYKFYDFSNNIYLDFEQISEGFRNYILLLSDIIFRILIARNQILTKDNSLNNIFEICRGAIIIDEFDKHMHPTWQRSFLKTLRAEFPLIQFFLTSHNPVTIQSAEGERLFLISEQNGKISVESKIIPAGYSIETIYSEYFNSYPFSEQVKNQLEELKSWRNEILRTKDFSKMEHPDFKRILSKISSISSETAVIAEIELSQLLNLKKNAETAKK